MDNTVIPLSRPADSALLAVMADEPAILIDVSISDDPRTACAQLNAELAQSLQYALRYSITDAPRAPLEGDVPSGLMLRYGNVLAYRYPKHEDPSLDRQTRLYMKIFFQLSEEVVLVHGEDDITGYPVGFGLKRMEVVSSCGHVSEFLLMQLNPWIFGDVHILDLVPDFKPFVDRVNLGGLVISESLLQNSYPAVFKELKIMQNIDPDCTKQPVNWLEFWR